MQKNHFLLFKKFKNIESAQLCAAGQYTIYRFSDKRIRQKVL